MVTPKEGAVLASSSRSMLSTQKYLPFTSGKYVSFPGKPALLVDAHDENMLCLSNS